MHVLVIFIFMTAVYQRNTARASGQCGVPESPQNSNIKPVTIDRLKRFEIHTKFRFECVDGYVRKAGTSSQIRCIEEKGTAKWDPKPQYPLVCIPDPSKPTKTTETTPMPEQHFTSHTTKGTQTSTVLNTSRSTAGYTTFTATNEVATTKTRTTNLPTMRTTIKETESPTTPNEIPASTSSTNTSRPNMTTRASSPTQSSLFTTTAENTPVNDQQISSSAIGGVAGIFIVIILVAASFLIWWRLKHRPTNSIIEIQLYTSHTSSDTYIPVPVSDSGHCSAETNAADASTISTTDSIHDTK